MNQDFVPFELAVKLKEKGFREKCFATFDNSGIFSLNNGYAYSNVDLKDLLYSHNSSTSNIWVDAPTISQVLKWLRKEKGLHIEILHIFSEKTLWDFEVTHIGGYGRWWSNLELFDTYKQAALAGIEYVLDNLI